MTKTKQEARDKRRKAKAKALRNPPICKTYYFGRKLIY